MENNVPVPVAVETYRSPETKVMLKAMTDPRPHKLALSYLKARVRQILRKDPMQKKALWTRPIDDIAYVAKDGVRTLGAAGGAVAGSKVGGLVAQGNPYARIVGALLGSVAGGYAAGRAGDATIDGGIQMADSAGVLPQSLTHVNIMSDRQSKYSNMGSALGIASVVPLAARIIMKGETNPLLAVGGALGSAYLMSRIGNAAGNMAGYYADRREQAYEQEA
jgi:hypothetical protein